MYCHDLRALRDGTTYTIQCEDSPVSDGLVGIWPYDLQLDADTYSSLIKALHEWAADEGLFYRIYVTCDRFEPAPSVANKQAEQDVHGNTH